MKTSVKRITLEVAILAACLTAQVPDAAEKARPLASRVQSFDKVAEEKAAWGSLRWLINAKLDPPSSLTLGDVTINAGQSNPPHVHANADEVIYVLSGSCEQRVGRESVILKAGDALRIPAGAARGQGPRPPAAPRGRRVQYGRAAVHSGPRVRRRAGGHRRISLTSPVNLALLAR